MNDQVFERTVEMFMYVDFPLLDPLIVKRLAPFSLERPGPAELHPWNCTPTLNFNPRSRFFLYSFFSLRDSLRDVCCPQTLKTSDEPAL